MPSTVGHLLGGVATAWTADLVPGRRGWRTAPASASSFRRAGNGWTAACAVIAALPDADLLFHIHRTYTHSVGAVMLVGAVAAVVAVYAARPVARVALMCAAAVGSHLLLDWTAVDRVAPYGIQAFWPFTDRWYISGWDLFRQTQRSHVFAPEVMRLNGLAVAQEIAILLPLVVLLWFLRRRALRSTS